MIILGVFKALVYTAVFSLFITPVDFKLASAMGAIDIPKDSRRMHTRPIPRIGGLSVFISFVVFSLIFCKETAPDLISIISGAVIIVILGIADDSIGVSAKIKLAVQSIAVVLAILPIILNGDIISSLLIFLWLITSINAHNFIDGLDGLCVGISLIEAMSIGIIFLFEKQPEHALLAFILGGACVGFYPYNAKNAKIFMGDTGSTFLGFVLGLLTVEALKTPHSYIALISICFIFIIPISDITFAVIRRLSHGKSPFEADRSHIHHILSDSTLGHENASLVLRSVSLIFSLVGTLLFIIFS